MLKNRKEIRLFFTEILSKKQLISLAKYNIMRGQSALRCVWPSLIADAHSARRPPLCGIM